jgi:hypothetical protein
MKETGRFSMNLHRILSRITGLIILAGCDAPSPIFSMDKVYSGCLCDAKIASHVELVDEDSWLSVALTTDDNGKPNGDLFFDGSIRVYGQAIYDYTGEPYIIENLHLDAKGMHGRVDSPTSPALKLRGFFEEETEFLVLNARGIGKLELSEGEIPSLNEDEGEHLE